ncbi:MAG: tetratricopeptide repeat protein [Acidobacteria bacterium]|nr:tetratricopeptide repeat protein [Acidobacteriota bacterium]
MRPETKRRVVFIFGVAVCGCAVMLSCAWSAFGQASDPTGRAGPGMRPRMWATSDPLKDRNWQSDETAPVLPSASTAKVATVGDTISVSSMQLPAGAIKEFRRSEKCVGSGDFSCAVQHLQKALKVDPKFVEAHNNLGASFMQLQRYQDAIAEFEAAIAINSKIEAPYRNKSLSLFLLERYPEAEAAARQALQINPEHKSSRYTLGRALAAEGSASPEAERLLRDALTEFPEARLPLAQVLLNRCANLDAAAELRTYLASNSVSAEERHAVEAWLDLSSKGQVVSGCA